MPRRHTPRKSAANGLSQALCAFRKRFRRLLRLWLGDVSRTAKIASAFQEFDVNYSRTLNSAFTGAPFTPGTGYQLGLGNLNSFRFVNDLTSTAAAEVDNVKVSTGVRLPGDLELSATGQWSVTQNYTERLDNTQALIEGHQTQLPSFRVRWTDSLPALRKYITRFNVNAGVDLTRQTTFAPGETPDEPADSRSTRIRTYPLSTSLFWAGSGSVVTNFGYTITRRVDSLPGSITNTNTQDVTGDAARQFHLPPSWGFIYPISARVTWDFGTSSSFVSVNTTTPPSRLSDNGRSAITLSAGAPVAPNLKFSLLGSRTITYDNNLDRAFSQIIITVVFNLEYFAGAIR